MGGMKGFVGDRIRKLATCATFVIDHLVFDDALVWSSCGDRWDERVCGGSNTQVGNLRYIRYRPFGV